MDTLPQSWARPALRIPGAKRLPAIALLWFVCLSLAACGTTVRRHPKFDDLKASLRIAALLPPSVNVILVDTGKRAQRMPEEETAQFAKLSELLGANLSKLPMDVRWVTAEPDGRRSALNAQLEAVQDSFLAKAEFLWAKEERPEKKAFAFDVSLDGPVSALAGQVGASSVVVSDFYQVHTTFKYAAKEFSRRFLIGALLTAATLGYVVFIPSPRSTEGCVLEIAFADGQTGAVVWANRASDGGKCGEKTIRALVEDALEPYPGVAAR